MARVRQLLAGACLACLPGRVGSAPPTCHTGAAGSAGSILSGPFPSMPGAGGLGDGVSGTLTGLAGGTQVLDICVDQGGSSGGAASGGGAGGNGGGATGVSLGSDLSSPVIVAGGGGGGGGVSDAPAAGGGGGSDFCAASVTACTVSAGAGTQTTAGSGTGDAQLTITYTPAPADAPLTTTHTAAAADQHRQAAAGVTFTDADPNGNLSQYSGTITWGDGTTTAIPHSLFAKVPAWLGGGFAAGGTHAYTKAGTYTVTFTINDTGGASAQASTTVKVP